jgi:hypothetical protein
MNENIATNELQEEYVSAVGECLTQIPEADLLEMLDELRTHIAALTEGDHGADLDLVAVLGEPETYASELVQSAGYELPTDDSITQVKTNNRRLQVALVLAVLLAVSFFFKSGEYGQIQRQVSNSSHNLAANIFRHSNRGQTLVLPNLVGMKLAEVSSLLPSDSAGRVGWQICKIHVAHNSAVRNQILDQSPSAGVQLTTSGERGADCLDVTVSDGWTGASDPSADGTPYCNLSTWDWRVVMSSESSFATEIIIAARNKEPHQCIASGFPRVLLAGPYIASQATDGVLRLNPQTQNAIPGILSSSIVRKPADAPVNFIDSGYRLAFRLKLPVLAQPHPACDSVGINNAVVDFGDDLGRIFMLSEASQSIDVCRIGSSRPSLSPYQNKFFVPADRW